MKTLTQSEWDAGVARFKAATETTFELNVCKGIGVCAKGCIGHGRRCPFLPSASIETLAAVQAEYDAAFLAISDGPKGDWGVNVVPDEPPAQA